MLLLINGSPAGSDLVFALQKPADWPQQALHVNHVKVEHGHSVDLSSLLLVSDELALRALEASPEPMSLIATKKLFMNLYEPEHERVKSELAAAKRQADIDGEKRYAEELAAKKLEEAKLGKAGKSAKTTALGKVLKNVADALQEEKDEFEPEPLPGMPVDPAEAAALEAAPSLSPMLSPMGYSTEEFEDGDEAGAAPEASGSIIENALKDAVPSTSWDRDRLVAYAKRKNIEVAEGSSKNMIIRLIRKAGG